MLRVHSFESMGTFDGPGLRLVVFLQGCNFQCLYCANPDTIPIGKGGKLIEESEVLRRAISERPFFGKRGGVTFSGGEPTVQAEALIPLCRALKEEGIHICLDSQGSIRNRYVDELLSIVDMVLLDCKHMLPKEHQHFGGFENIERLELLPYHTYGKHKYETLGKPYLLEDVHEPTHEEIASAQAILERYFPVVWTQ